MSLPGRISIEGGLPPIPEAQTRAGSCTAHAVVALLEYMTDCRTRLSVAFLFAAMRIKVREWLDRNLEAIARGKRGDADFEHVFSANLAGLRCVLDGNAPDSKASRRFTEMFRKRVQETFAVDRGCPIRFASDALQEYGICRHAFWPEGDVGAAVSFAGDESTLPDAACADARRRRFANGLDFLPEPGNVEAIKAVLAGANDNRKMPVVLALGPDGEHDAHAVLAVGYQDDAAQPGGGFFLVRDGSGSRRPARLPYAETSERCTEAATILQSRADYYGDGYGGFVTRRRVRRTAFAAAVVALAAVGLAGWLAWRNSPAVVDAPFAWLASPGLDVERLVIVGDATYGSCLNEDDCILRQFFKKDQQPRVSASMSYNGVAVATSGRPDILMLFARSSAQPYSASDKAAIADYLSSGGTVLVFVCDCNRPTMADLLAPYGVKIQGVAGKPPIRAVAPKVRDGQRDGYSYFRIVEMTGDWHALIVTDDGTDSPVMAFRRVGNGKLFCAAQQLFGTIGGKRSRNSDWWGDLLFACAADSCCAQADKLR